MSMNQTDPAFNTSVSGQGSVSFNPYGSMSGAPGAQGPGGSMSVAQGAAAIILTAGVILIGLGYAFRKGSKS